MSKTQKQEIGDIGEKISARFLKGKGFIIIGTNYRKKWGEIDIIAKKRERIHFVEVKTISFYYSSVIETKINKEKVKKVFKAINFLNKCTDVVSEKFLPLEMSYAVREVFEGEGSCETGGYRPEDNLHPWKLERLKRAITSYFEEKTMSEEDDWQFDAITVRLDEKNKIALIEYLEDIIL